MLLLLALGAFLPLSSPLVNQGNYFFTSQPIVQPSGAVCTHHFYKTEYAADQTPSVESSSRICSDYGRHQTVYASIGIRRVYSTIRMRDIPTLFGIVNKNYKYHPNARSFTFFAVAGSDTCMTVTFVARQMKRGKLYVRFTVEHKSSEASQVCDRQEGNREVTSIVCVADNCTLPEPPSPPPTTPNPMVIARSDSRGEHQSVLATTKQCLRYLRHEVVPLQTYNEHRLWVIVAGVACNLVSMAFLAGLIHYCMKYRHLRRHYRMLTGPMGSLGPGSIAGTTSPTPAVRHLGSTVSSGAQLIHLSPTGGAFPDYQYSSIARRKLKNQQQQQHRQLLLNANGHHHLDDETLSYRSDHARLLMPANGAAAHGRHGSISSVTLQRHNSGAVSPPRGWGGPNEAPSTPGSIRRHGSISAMSVTSSGYPRRNGALPAPPAHMLKQPPPQHTPPPPPPPVEGTVIY